MTIPYFILSVLFYAVTVYDTECLVVGNCHAWSWIRTILYLIIPTIYVVTYIWAMVKLAKMKKEAQNANTVTQESPF